MKQKTTHVGKQKYSLAEQWDQRQTSWFLTFLVTPIYEQVVALYGNCRIWAVLYVKGVTWLRYQKQTVKQPYEIVHGARAWNDK